MELAGRVGSSQLKVPSLSPQPRPRQSPASEGEEEELMMEEEEEEVLTGASAEDKSRRPPVKGPSEPVHPGERWGEEGRRKGRRPTELRWGRRLGASLAFLFLRAPKMPG